MHSRQNECDEHERQGVEDPANDESNHGSRLLHEIVARQSHLCNYIATPIARVTSITPRQDKPLIGRILNGVAGERIILVWRRPIASCDQALPSFAHRLIVSKTGRTRSALWDE